MMDARVLKNKSPKLGVPSMYNNWLQTQTMKSNLKIKFNLIALDPAARYSLAVSERPGGVSPGTPVRDAHVVPHGGVVVLSCSINTADEKEDTWQKKISTNLRRHGKRSSCA